MAAAIDIEQLATQLQAGDRGSLARSITLLESQRAAHRALSQQLLALLPSPNTVRSQRIGITGSPGAGKSTLLERYGSQLTSQGHRVAVLAVDPSSNRTRGSILGDKTRMELLSRDPQAFVRPSPAGTTLGGVTRATRESILVCEAAGYDRILIETVGVGQSEHAVRDLVDVMVLLVLPGSGDDLQGIKRGIVELCDIVLVNKADGERVSLARETARHYRQALHLQPARELWTPVSLTGSALTPEGLTSLGESLTAFFNAHDEHSIAQQRQAQAARYFRSAWRDALADKAIAMPEIRERLTTLTDAITTGGIDAEKALASFVASLHLEQQLS